MNTRALLLVSLFITLSAISGHAQSGAGGGSHTLLVKPDGTVWVWGGNGNGQLGDGTTTQRVLPITLGSLTSMSDIAAGGSHSIVAKSDGTVWTWGVNSNGQLGDATTTQRNAPVQVTTLSGMTAVAAGLSHSVALKSDGTVWAWGLNSSGQVGDSTTTQRTSPVHVTTLSGIVAIAAGGYHTAAVKSDGTVWTWGLNATGQLGDNSTTQRTAPVQVTGLTAVSAVGAGASHSVALKSDGTVKAWGANYWGQLGDGTTTQRTTPVSVSGISSATAIAVGGHHALAVRQDLSAWAWGSNWDGQLGDGTTTYQTTAVSVATLSNLAMIGAGDRHSLAVSTDGTVWAWGRNFYGQIGDGTTMIRLNPVKVSEAAYDWKVGTPTFSIPSGSYTAVQNVVVASATSGATIHYTTNGANPTESDATVASGSPVVVNQSLTLKAKAWKTGVPASNIDGTAYTLTVATPTIAPNSGTYNVDQTVTVSSTVSGATLHYTTNGNAPTEADPTITSGGTLSITQSQTLKVKGWATSWTSSAVASATYTMKVGTPSVSPGGGSYTSAQTVTVTTSTSGATLRYTLTGIEPTTADTVIASGGTVQVSNTVTLRVKGWKTGWTDSDTRVATYTLNLGTGATPTMTPPGGTYTSAQSVTLSSTTSGATLRYTLDGTDPTFRSTVYAAPLIVNAPITVKARAFKTDWTPSATGSATYVFDFGTVDVPTLVPPGGTYPTSQAVTVSTATAGATLRYTTTGVDPTETDTTITSGSTLNLTQSQRLKVKAWHTGTTPSAVRTADYWITGTVAAGGEHTLALKADGTVWTWGWNVSGQLGDGTTTQRTSPVQVPSLTDVVAIAGGWVHSLALKRDGTVRAWGNNSSGQLGDGTSTQRLTPVSVLSLTNVVAIAAGTTAQLRGQK